MTTPIGLFYGTNTGYTELVVDIIEEEFSFVAPDLLTVHNIADELDLVRFLEPVAA